MLTIFRRHLKSCPQTSRSYRRCKCPIHVEGSLGGEKIRKSLDLNNWEAAQNRVRKWEAKGKIELQQSDQADTTTVERAVGSFMEDSKARHLAESTLKNFRVLLEKYLIQYCQDRGIRFLKELNAEELTTFRASWGWCGYYSTKKARTAENLLPLLSLEKMDFRKPCSGTWFPQR